MLRGIWYIVLIASILLLLGCAALTIQAHHQRDATFDAQSKTIISISDHCHLGVISSSMDVRLAVFSDRIGPYRGNILGIAGDPWPIVTGCGDSWGVYFRFILQHASRHFTLLISIWWIVAVASIVPTGEVVRRII